MKVRAIRGAIQVSADEVELINEAVTTLVAQMISDNGLTSEDLISILFTSTVDLVSTFPATAARSMPVLAETPLISATEVEVSSSLPRTIRAILHAYSPRQKSEIRHIYLAGAQVLRPDLAK
jgi:chorismate mutase